MRRHAAFVLSIAVSGALASACGGAASSSPTSTPPPEAADFCTASAERGEAPVDAGHYRVVTTEPAISFDLPDGYSGVCDSGTVALFGSDGQTMIVVLPLDVVRANDVRTPIEPNVEAITDLVVGGVVEATEVEPVTIGGAGGVGFVVTVDAAGIAFRSPGDRGWGFNNEEAETAAITLLKVGDAVAAIVRHGEDPAAASSDVFGSLQFE